MGVKKAPTKADREWFAKIGSLGCVVCGARDVEVHHLTGAGMGLRASHQDSIPLCVRHHRTGGYGVAVHAGTKAFDAKYGTQRELLEKTRQLLAVCAD